MIEKIGDVGKKLHTGRSRNDQVALDTRMYTKDVINQIINPLIDLQNTIIEIAKEHHDHYARLYPPSKSSTYNLRSSFNGLF